LVGFIMMHAREHMESDRENGVRAFPDVFAVPPPMLVTRACHVANTLLLGWFGVLAHAGAALSIGLAVVAGAVVYEHAIVRPNDLSKLNRDFFHTNSFVRVSLFVFALADLVI
ncbi:prenyltransferase, partial [Streptomyces rubellomurinus subsp. indigoferus]